MPPPTNYAVVEHLVSPNTVQGEAIYIYDSGVTGSDFTGGYRPASASDFTPIVNISGLTGISITGIVDVEQQMQIVGSGNISGSPVLIVDVEGKIGVWSQQSGNWAVALTGTGLVTFTNTGIAITNFPAIQEVSGTVSVANLSGALSSEAVPVNAGPQGYYSIPTGTGVEVLAANTGRKTFIIQNDSEEAAYISFGGNSGISGFGLYGGGTFDWSDNSSRYTGSVWITGHIANTGTIVVKALEFTL